MGKRKGEQEGNKSLDIEKIFYSCLYLREETKVMKSTNKPPPTKNVFVSFCHYRTSKLHSFLNSTQPRFYPDDSNRKIFFFANI